MIINLYFYLFSLSDIAVLDQLLSEKQRYFLLKNKEYYNIFIFVVY